MRDGERLCAPEAGGVEIQSRTRPVHVRLAAGRDEPVALGFHRRLQEVAHRAFGERLPGPPLRGACDERLRLGRRRVDRELFADGDDALAARLVTLSDSQGQASRRTSAGRERASGRTCASGESSAEIRTGNVRPPSSESTSSASSARRRIGGATPARLDDRAAGQRRAPRRRGEAARLRRIERRRRRGEHRRERRGGAERKGRSGVSLRRILLVGGLS